MGQGTCHCRGSSGCHHSQSHLQSKCHSHYRKASTASLKLCSPHAGKRDGRKKHSTIIIYIFTQENPPPWKTSTSTSKKKWASSIIDCLGGRGRQICIFQSCRLHTRILSSEGKYLFLHWRAANKGQDRYGSKELYKLSLFQYYNKPSIKLSLEIEFVVLLWRSRSVAASDP